MAQVLSVLALSTKEMKQRSISGPIHLIFSFVADYETEKLMKRIAGRTDVEDAVQRLDVLTKEENLMMAARNLEATHRVDVNVNETKELTRDVRDNVITIDENVKVTRHGAQNSFEIFINFTDRASQLWRQQLMNSNVRRTLMVSSPTVIAEACSQGISYERSFESGSLLRIPQSIIIPRATSSTKEPQRGSSRATHSTSGRRTDHYCGSVAIVCSPYCRPFITIQVFFLDFSGLWKEYSLVCGFATIPIIGTRATNSVLSSAIIEDIKHTRKSRSALVAYYYLDFKDVAKRDVRGLLASILLQLVDDSGPCWDTLHQLYKSYRLGSEQPSDAALVKCLVEMIDLPEQVPIYLILDALDECPNTTGTPSAREKVLNFVRDLLKSDHSNLFVCITSRPEQDISSTLNPLTSPSSRVSLHEEGGQRQDIDSYVRSFVQTDASMRRWRAEDKELVISVLSERAAGM